MSPRDIMVVRRSFCAYTPLESIYHNIFVIILLLYHLGSQKKCLALVSIHYFVSFGHFKIRTLLSQGDKTGNFFTLYRQDCGVKKISIESTLCFFYSKHFCGEKNTSYFVVNIKLLLLYRGFQTIHMFILGQFKRL